VTSSTISVVAATALAISICSTCQATTLHSESFKSAPSGESYTLTTVFDDGIFDFFDRNAVPDNSNPSHDDFQNGWNGNFDILGQDRDGDDGPATVGINLDPVAITGQSDLGV